jgi:hypothetical protein
MPHVQNPSLGAGQVPLLSTTTRLTAAQLLAIDSTPFTVVPAPGAGKIVALVGVAFVYDFGAHPYQPPIDPEGFQIFYAGSFANLITFLSTNLIERSQSSYLYLGAAMTADVPILPGSDNKAVQLNGGPFSGGAILTTTIGAGGLGYVANDTGTLLDGNSDATYRVLTVGAGGAVLTYSITAPGTHYIVENNSPTATGGAQPGVGVGFTVNITAVQNGDGTLKVTAYYQILPVP